MGSDGIIQKINERAEAEAGVIRLSGEEKARENGDRLLAAARENAQRLRAAGLREAEEVRARERLKSEMEVRKNTLAAKRGVIDEAFRAALEQLCALGDAEWEALAARIVHAECMSGDVTLHFSKQDYERRKDSMEKLAKRWSKELSAERGEDCRLTVGSPEAIRGGIRFSAVKCDLDASYEMLLRNVRENHEHEIASMLFPVIIDA